MKTVGVMRELVRNRGVNHKFGDFFVAKKSGQGDDGIRIDFSSAKFD